MDNNKGNVNNNNNHKITCWVPLGRVGILAIIRNWRNVYPTIAHKSGLDWRLLSMATKTHGDIEAQVEPKFQCLKTITYVSLAKLQPSLSYEPHDHQDHEEVYYIISGSGYIKIDGETVRFRDGDVIYIPEKAVHSIANDGNEMVEFIAFGGFTGSQPTTTSSSSSPSSSSGGSSK